MKNSNALKHGILSNMVLLKSERAETLENLRTSLNEEFMPIGGLESMLVERIIVNFWRLRRIIYVEKNSMDYFENKGIIFSDDPVSESVKNTLDNDAIEKVLRYETTVERSLFRTMHELERLQAKRRGEKTSLPNVLDVNISGESFVS
jgi:hypothetical protein